MVILFSHIKEYYLDTLLISVPSLKNNYYDIIIQYTTAIYNNYLYYTEFLEKKLRLHKKSNILEENS